MKKILKKLFIVALAIGVLAPYIEIPVVTNIQYKIQIPTDVKWVRYSQTKATREETLVLFVETNVETTEREAVVHLVDLDGNEIIKKSYGEVKNNGNMISIPAGDYVLVARSVEEEMEIARENPLK